MNVGLTFDTVALSALERRRPRRAQVYATAVRHRIPIPVPYVVLVEWQRGQSTPPAMTLTALTGAFDMALLIQRLTG